MRDPSVEEFREVALECESYSRVQPAEQFKILHNIASSTGYGIYFRYAQETSRGWTSGTEPSLGPCHHFPFTIHTQAQIF